MLKDFPAQEKGSSVLVMNVDVAYLEELLAKGRHLVILAMLYQVLVRAEMDRLVKV